MNILNFGSLNLDYIYEVAHFPAPGETLAALSQRVVPGGKGLNQSVALARAGARVCHAGLVGRGGETLRETLTSAGVDVRYLQCSDALQGNAVIEVNRETGENRILLYGGSNQAITPAQVAQTLADFSSGDLLVLQNEVSCLPEIVSQALARGMRIALNPSPFDETLLSLPIERLDWLFINEIEGAQMTGERTPEAMLLALRTRYPALKVVLTLGSEGSLCAVPGQDTLRQPIFPVQAVDTTAAGDTFTGFFLAGYASGLPLPVCLRRAAAASAISVSRAGASVSIPSAAEVDQLLAER